MKPWINWTVGILVVLVICTEAFSLYDYFQPQTSAQSSPSPTPAPSSNDKFAFVSALGRLEPRGRVIRLTASPAVEGARLAQLLVKEGDEIKVGQIVAVLDSQQRLQATVVEAERQVAIAQAKLAQVQAGARRGDVVAQEAALQRLEIEQQNALTELQRSERLHSSGDVPASEVESRKLTLNTIAKEACKQSSVARVSIWN